MSIFSNHYNYIMSACDLYVCLFLYFVFKEHKLLGYDWIASVIDNKGETSLEISDEHFEELRTFWKEQQGRPITDVNLL